MHLFKIYYSYRFQRQCVQLLCSPLRKLEADKCEPIYAQIAGVVYIFTARLNPTEKQQMIVSEYWIFERLKSFFRIAFLQDYFIQGDHYSVYTRFCYQNIQSVVSKVCNTTGFNSFFCSHRVDYYDIELHFEISQFHSLNDILDRYLNLTNSEPILSVDLADETLHFQILPEELDYNLPATSFQDKCSSRAERIMLSQQTSCPLVELTLTDYKWIDEDGTISFNSSFDVALNKS